MSKKVKICAFLLFIMLLFMKYNAYAKYVIADDLNMEVYIDKTAPVIQLKSNHNNGSYEKTNLEDIIKNNCPITVDTTDNIKIKENKYIFNPMSSNFDNIPPINFETGTTLQEDGYYKIIAIDTFGNKTEIIVLIDKTPPKIDVQFYKKGTVSKANTQIIGGETRNLVSSKEIETTNNKKVNIVGGKTRNLLAAGNGASIEVFNESDLRNALNNRYSNIVIHNSINISSTLYINYGVTISPNSANNALAYTGYGNFIVIQAGGSLMLDSIVVDTRGHCSNRGVVGINIETNGSLITKTSSIIDAGAQNIGVLVNSGATAEIRSCLVAYADKGILVQGNGNLVFNPESDRTSDFINNTVGIYYENFTGIANLNTGKIKISNNSEGVVFGNSTGTLNIYDCNIYSNIIGIDFCRGVLNISGGNIYENATGILLNQNYEGTMTITNVNIYSNTQYAINNSKSEDGSCNIFGGNISGKVFLALHDNYVNTNDKYPTFEVTPAEYFFKRKLVKTTDNNTAKTEISKVALTPKDAWYTYVDSEYIVLWTGGNVFVRYKDYYGNILKEEFKNGTIGTNYSITPPAISGYDLIYTPENANGTYTQNDIIVDFKYDLVNVAKVNYEDLLSGVVSAKYWYNANAQSFSGNGSDFSNGTVFEQYGYYKIIVTNGVGLQKTITFTLNKNSLVR